MKRPACKPCDAALIQPLAGLRRIRQRTPLICAAGIMASLASAGAASVVWDGGASPDNRWTTPANWVADIAPSSFDSLVFDGAAGFTNVNDFDAGTTFLSLAFTSTAGAFTLGGNAVGLG